MRRPLTSEEFTTALDGWTGRAVSVRVVSKSDDLLTVFCGELCERSGDKKPALFWPLAVAAAADHAEQPGIYLHAERFQSAAAHTGEWVLELQQGEITLNIRRL